MSRNVVGRDASFPSDANFSKYLVDTWISFSYRNTGINRGLVFCPRNMVVYRIYPLWMGKHLM